MITNADVHKNMVWFDGNIYYFMTEHSAYDAYMSVLEGTTDLIGFTHSVPMSKVKFDHWVSVDSMRDDEELLNELEAAQREKALELDESFRRIYGTR